MNRFKSKYPRRNLRVAESERTMPYPDVARWVSAARTSGGNTEASGSRAGLQALRPKEGVKEDFIYLFTFPNVSNTAILITLFT